MANDNRLKAVENAACDGYTRTDLARLVGTTSNNLAGLLKRAQYSTRQSSPYLRKLDQWLRHQGYWPSETLAPQCVCRTCKTRIPGLEAGLVFCGACGARIGKYCEHCRRANPLNAKFCCACGKPME